MADKFRNTYPISINFAAGDMPTHVKLGNLSTAAQLSSRLLERAIGDPWNQSGDSFLQAYPLYQVNVARALGEMQKVSPKVVSARDVDDATTVVSFTYVDPIHERYVGKYEASLRYKPTSLGASPISGTSAPTVDAGSRSAVSGTAEYYYDATTGKLYTYAAIGADWKVTYTVEIEPDLAESADRAHSAQPNVIPDERFARGLRLKYKNGDPTQGYELLLPPREVPTGTYADEFFPDISASNQAASGKYWWTGGPAATSDAKLRWLLPVRVRGRVEGDAIPEGYVQIYDTSTKTIIQGLSMQKGSTNYSIYVTNQDVAEFATAASDDPTNIGASLTDATDTLTYYTNRFRLITAGTSLADATSILAYKAANHSHNGTGGARVNHADLDGLDSQLPVGAIHFRGSYGASDSHPYYLHRLGYVESPSRDQYNGAMLGTLLLSSTSSTNNYLNLAAQSYAVRFGMKGSGAPLIHFDNTNSAGDNVAATWQANDAGAYTASAQESSAAGVLEAKTGDFRISPTQDGETYNDGVSARLWLEEGILRYYAGSDAGGTDATFQLGRRVSNSSTRGAHLFARSGIFGLDKLTNISPITGDQFQRKDIETGHACVLISDQSGSGGIPIGDISIGVRDNEASYALLRLNSGPVSHSAPVHTVIDGPTGSYLYLRRNRLIFGDYGSENRLDHDGVGFFSFKFAGNTTGSSVSCGVFTSVDRQYNFGSSALYLKHDTSTFVLNDTLVTNSSSNDIGDSTTGRWGTGYFTDVNVSSSYQFNSATPERYISLSAAEAQCLGDTNIDSSDLPLDPNSWEESSASSHHAFVWHITGTGKGRTAVFSVKVPDGATLTSILSYYTTHSSSAANSVTVTTELFEGPYSLTSLGSQIDSFSNISTGSIIPRIGSLTGLAVSIDNQNKTYLVAITASSITAIGVYVSGLRIGYTITSL